MFDVTSSKLLILGVVALLVVGPKDLPALLRTVGRYMGIIKRHAAEFRAQFDEAMREAELEQLKKEVEGLGSTAEAQMRAAEQSLQAELGDPVATAAPRQGAEEGAAPEPGVAAAGEPALPGAVAAAGRSIACARTRERALVRPCRRGHRGADENRQSARFCPRGVDVGFVCGSQQSVSWSVAVSR